MRDWIVILSIATASLVIGFWALRARFVVRGETPAAADTERWEAGTMPSEAPVPVPNTTIPPLPEYRFLATLDFSGPPGKVPVQRGEVVIGRHSGDDVVIPDVRVSRHHARLVARSDGGFEIHNLTAVRPEPNSMLVNGTDREHADIVDGDVITLGGVSFQFRLAAA